MERWEKLPRRKVGRTSHSTIRRSDDPSIRRVVVATVAAQAALLFGVVPTAATQSIAERVAAVNTGVVRLSFAAKPGVCGNGPNINLRRYERDRHWESDCDAGPVRVVLTVSARVVIDIDTYVGGRWRAAGDATDLGMVSAAAAARYLLDVARRGDSKVAKEAILPALLADSVEAWPQLLEIAKDARRPREVRRHALFRVAQAAGDRVAAELGQIVDDPNEDDDVKDSAIFAISRLPGDQGVPLLIDIARTNPRVTVRRRAMFWLARSDDPRALQLFEEILTRR